MIESSKRVLVVLFNLRGAHLSEILVFFFKQWEVTIHVLTRWATALTLSWEQVWAPCVRHPLTRPCAPSASIWNRVCSSPGQNPEARSYTLLQGIFPTQGSDPGLPHCRRVLYQLSPRGRPLVSSRGVWASSWATDPEHHAPHNLSLLPAHSGC